MAKTMTIGIHNPISRSTAVAPQHVDVPDQRMLGGIEPGGAIVSGAVTRSI